MISFENPRLFFRPLQASDQALYCTCYTDPSLMQLIGTPLTDEAASRSFLAALKVNARFPVRRRDWVIHEKSSGLDAGLVTLACDREMPEARTGQLGVILFPPFQGKGYATEATGAAADAAFEHTKLDSLLVQHTEQNIAVSYVCMRLGFLRETREDSHDTDWHWSLTRDRWQALKKKPDRNG